MQQPNHQTSPAGIACPYQRLHVPHSDQRQLAQLILTTWTGRGALVADLDNDPTIEALAAETRRRYYAPDSADLHSPTDRGWADLVLLSWPRPNHPHQLLANCRRILQPVGRIIIRVLSPHPLRIGHLRALAGAASHTQLRVTGHLACLDEPQGTAHTDLLVLDPVRNQP